MGMRCDQFAGLNPWATRLIEGCGKPHFTGKYATEEVVLPESNHEVGHLRTPIMEPCVRREPSGRSYLGMFEEEYPLMQYAFRDGRVLYEAVQAEPWSSGPVFFLALRDEKGNWISESLWDDADIDDA